MKDRAINRRDILRVVPVAAGSLLLPSWAGASALPELVRVSMSDGASLALEAGGAGPSVLIVHGAGTTRKSWAKVATLLQPRFRTYALDRRGRGDSTDGAAYSLQREAEDVAQVVAALPGPVFVVGHSIGALITLEAMRLTDRLAKAVLYEPAIPVPGAARDDPRPVCDAVAAGDNDRAMVIFFRDYVLMPERTVDGFRADPSWPQRVKLAPTVCREVTARGTYRFDPARFARIPTPTLFLLGGDSDRIVAAGTRAGAEALAHGRIEVLPGQQHVAHLTEPDVVANDIAAFFAS